MRDGGLRKLFANRFTQAHWQSVETWSTGQGVPDAEYCFPGGVQGWLEFKKTTGWTSGIRPGQVAWIERRIRVGGRVFIAIRRQCALGVRREQADELYLYHGRWVRILYDHGLGATAPLALCKGGPGRWDWDKVLKILTS